MKIIEFHLKNHEKYEDHRIPNENHENHKNLLEFHVRIMKIIKIIEFHLKIMKIIKS